MTDFDRTSNSKTANILSASRDWLPVIVQTHSYENLKPRTGLMIPIPHQDDLRMYGNEVMDFTVSGLRLM
jgi:hypothetical protein